AQLFLIKYRSCSKDGHENMTDCLNFDKPSCFKCHEEHLTLSRECKDISAQKKFELRQIGGIQRETYKVKAGSIQNYSSYKEKIKTDHKPKQRSPIKERH
ncbi:hypothetical protein KPH14_009738, partial [Odynerus spinipes]